MAKACLASIESRPRKFGSNGTRTCAVHMSSSSLACDAVICQIRALFAQDLCTGNIPQGLLWLLRKTLGFALGLCSTPLACCSPLDSLTVGKYCLFLLLCSIDYAPQHHRHHLEGLTQHLHRERDVL